MRTATRVTRRDAERVLAAVKRQWRVHRQAYDFDPEPELVRNFDWIGNAAPYAIVWEGGPFEWAMMLHGGTDDYGFTVEPASNLPRSVFAEPITSWALGLYPI